MPTKPKHLTKRQTAARLNLSARRLLDLAKEGKIKTCQERSARSRNQLETLFDAEDVERFARERNAPRVIDVGEPAEKPKRERRPPADPQLLALAVRAALPAAPEAPPVYWLTLAEAAARSHLPVRSLHALVRGGTLAALDTHRRGEDKYMVCPADLDGLRGERRSFPGKGI